MNERERNPDSLPRNGFHIRAKPTCPSALILRSDLHPEELEPPTEGLLITQALYQRRIDGLGGIRRVHSDG
ncbi:unnamed protein product [Arctogadus glacialis]